MSACTDNSHLGLVGCGATYSGRLQHSVAKVDWSAHPDGRAHVTFSNENTVDLCWHGEVMRDPATVTHRNPRRRLHQDAAGVWRQGEKAGFSRDVSPQSDAIPRDGS